LSDDQQAVEHGRKGVRSLVGDTPNRSAISNRGLAAWRLTEQARQELNTSRKSLDLLIYGRRAFAVDTKVFGHSYPFGAASHTAHNRADYARM
jgi:hypothetical protein